MCSHTPLSPIPYPSFYHILRPLISFDFIILLLIYRSPYREREKARGRKEDDRVRPEWAGGLAQQRELEEKRRELERLAAKPFAIGADDQDLEKDRKRRSRWGDPMAELAAKKAKGGAEGAAAAAPVSIAEALGGKVLKKIGFNIPLVRNYFFFVFFSFVLF
jgi:hypothetical protein